MALRHAVLAALLDGAASGYDLAKTFDASVANFWMATPQQLYRELEQMAADGLVRARMVRQERRPDKRLFSLTDAGVQALYDFTTSSVRPGVIRDDLMVQVQALDAGDPQAVKHAVQERMTWARAKIERFEALRRRILAGRTEAEHLAAAERVGPYLTLLRGLEFENENLRWGARVVEVLDRRQQNNIPAR